MTGGGPDTVNPGGGADTVSTGDGSDTIDSIDGVADAIDCGAGVTDSLSADKIDARKGCDLVVKDLDTLPPNQQPPVDPPVVDPPVVQPPVVQPPVVQPPVVQPPVVQPPVVQPPAAKLAVRAKVGKQRLRTVKRTKRLKLQLRVNRAARVAIKVTTRRHGKTIRLGSRSPRIAANQWVKVNVRLSKTQLRKLRKGKRIRIAFKASAGDSRATLARAVRAR